MNFVIGCPYDLVLKRKQHDDRASSYYHHPRHRLAPQLVAKREGLDKKLAAPSLGVTGSFWRFAVMIATAQIVRAS